MQAGTETQPGNGVTEQLQSEGPSRGLSPAHSEPVQPELPTAMSSTAEQSSEHASLLPRLPAALGPNSATGSLPGFRGQLRGFSSRARVLPEPEPDPPEAVVEPVAWAAARNHVCGVDVLQTLLAAASILANYRVRQELHQDARLYEVCSLGLLPAWVESCLGIGTYVQGCHWQTLHLYGLGSHACRSSCPPKHACVLPRS